MLCHENVLTPKLVAQMSNDADRRSSLLGRSVGERLEHRPAAYPRRETACSAGRAMISTLSCCAMSDGNLDNKVG